MAYWLRGSIALPAVVTTNMDYDKMPMLVIIVAVQWSLPKSREATIGLSHISWSCVLKNLQPTDTKIDSETYFLLKKNGDTFEKWVLRYAKKENISSSRASFLSGAGLFYCLNPVSGAIRSFMMRSTPLECVQFALITNWNHTNIKWRNTQIRLSHGVVWALAKVKQKRGL
jgi:hypothetical protein